MPLIVYASHISKLGVLRELLKVPGINVNAVDGFYAETALMQAVSNRNIDLLRELLKNSNVDINHKCKNGEDSLYKMVKLGFTAGVTELLKRADLTINQRCKWGRSALCTAVTRKKSKIFDALLADPHTLVDLRDDKLRTPLMLACGNQTSHKYIRKLISKGKADVNLKDTDGNTAAHIAIKSGNLKALKIILESDGALPNIVNNNGLTPLMLAVKGKCLNEVKYLLGCSDVLLTAHDKEGDSLLHVLVKLRISSLIPFVLKKDSSLINIVNSAGQSPLYLAVKLDSLNSIRELLKNDSLETIVQGQDTFALASIR